MHRLRTPLLRPCRALQGAEGEGYSTGPPAGEGGAADAAAWDCYWGWDCVGPGGLCERVFAHLGIARSSWAALKALPAVCSRCMHSRMPDSTRIAAHRCMRVFLCCEFQCSMQDQRISSSITRIPAPAKQESNVSVAGGAPGEAERGGEAVQGPGGQLT